MFFVDVRALGDILLSVLTDQVAGFAQSLTTVRSISVRTLRNLLTLNKTLVVTRLTHPFRVKWSVDMRTLCV